MYRKAKSVSRWGRVGMALPPSITPHAQRERGKVIDRGVHIYIYICLWTKKIFESYFTDRLTFSNIDSRTSHRIYCALQKHSPH